MLKLIKFEMIHSYRSFARVFAGYMIICVILPFLPYEISMIGTALTMFATFGISIAVFVTIIINFNNSMFKKPGYLTLTLPVTSHQLIISKIISTFIWLMITGVILFIGLFLLVFIMLIKEVGIPAVSIGEIFEAIGYLISTGIDVAGGEILLGIIQGIVSTVSTIIAMFTLITVVQTKYTRKNKTVWAFFIFFIYMFIGSYINTLIVGNVVFDGMDSFMNLSYYMIAISIVEAVVFYFITIYIIDHQIEIE